MIDPSDATRNHPKTFVPQISMARIDQLSVKYYIDPSTNPIRVAARSAYAQGAKRIQQVRAIIVHHALTHRPISMFDATIKTCEYHAEKEKSESAMKARERSARTERKVRRKSELREAV